MRETMTIGSDFAFTDDQVQEVLRTEKLPEPFRKVLERQRKAVAYIGDDINNLEYAISQAITKYVDRLTELFESSTDLDNLCKAIGKQITEQIEPRAMTNQQRDRLEAWAESLAEIPILGASMRQISNFGDDLDFLDDHVPDIDEIPTSTKVQTVDPKLAQINAQRRFAGLPALPRLH